MNRVMPARGIRLVSRKLISSCWVKVEIRPLTVMNLSAGLVSAVAHGFTHADSLPVHRRRRCRRGIPESPGAPRPVARQAPVADRAFQNVESGRAAGPALRIRHRRFLPL